MVEGLRNQLDNFERSGPAAMPVFIARSRRILDRAACVSCGWTGPQTQYLGTGRREITHPDGPHDAYWLPRLMSASSTES